MKERSTSRKVKFSGAKAGYAGGKAGDFARQLATVIIGIVVTFGGSALIQKNAQRKEARHLLEMVAQELADNAVRAQRQVEWFRYLKNGARALRPYIDNPRAVPVDTLIRYAGLSNNHLYAPGSNAFEVLKSSDAVKAIADKKLVLDLFSIYDRTANSASNAQSYTEMKVGMWEKYYGSVPRSMLVAVFDAAAADPLATFAHAAASPAIAQWIIESAQDNWLDSLTDEYRQLAEATAGMAEATAAAEN